MKTMKTFFIALFSLMMIGSTQAQNQILPLWEGDPPNYKETGEVTIWDTSDIVRVRNVQKPDIAIFLPSKKNATGEAVVICPGGGYQILAYDWEGSDIARWLNSKGIAAFVLKYRLPGSTNNIVPRLSPLMDAQRALRMVRSNAEKWNLDPSKIGIMGFSAGGHLASTLSTHYDAGDPDSQDPVDRVSCRPDFSILIYPVISFADGVTHQGSRDRSWGRILIRSWWNTTQMNCRSQKIHLLPSSSTRPMTALFRCRTALDTMMLSGSTTSNRNCMSIPTGATVTRWPLAEVIFPPGPTG